MIVFPILSSLALVLFLIYALQKWKLERISFSILILTLTSRLIGLAVYFYIINVKSSKELVGLRFAFDNCTYLCLIIFMFFEKYKAKLFKANNNR